MESTPGGWDEGKSKTLTEDGDKNERETERKEIKTEHLSVKVQW